MMHSCWQSLLLHSRQLEPMHMLRPAGGDETSFTLLDLVSLYCLKQVFFTAEKDKPNPFKYLFFTLTTPKLTQIKCCCRKGLLQVIKFFNFDYSFPFPNLYNKEIRLASNMKGCREQYKKHTGSSIFPAPFSVTYVKPSMPSAFLHSIGLLALE